MQFNIGPDEQQVQSNIYEKKQVLQFSLLPHLQSFRQFWLSQFVVSNVHSLLAPLPLFNIIIITITIIIIIHITIIIVIK